MMEQVKTQIREIKRQRVKEERVMEKSVTRRLTRLNRIEISFPSIVEVNVRREILQPAQSANREKSIEVLKRLRLARSCSETALVIPSITRGCALLCLLTFELLLLFFLFFCFPFFSFFFFIFSCEIPRAIVKRIHACVLAFLLKNRVRRNGNKTVYFKISRKDVKMVEDKHDLIPCEIIRVIRFEEAKNSTLNIDLFPFHDYPPNVRAKRLLLIAETTHFHVCGRRFVERLVWLMCSFGEVGSPGRKLRNPRDTVLELARSRLYSRNCV